MRKWVWLVGLVAIAIGVAFFLIRDAAKRNTLNVLNWDFYIGSNTLARYQASRDVRINYTIYASNEDARDRMRGAPGAFDVVFPSDYMMDYLIRNEMLEKLPEGGISNANPNVVDSAALETFRSRGWSQYCVPYLYGNTGFAVNNRRLQRSAQDISWSWLAGSEFTGKLLVLNDARQVISSVLIELGLDPNSTRASDLQRATDLLRKLKPKILEFTSDTGKERMLQGEAAVAFAWSGDSLQVAAERDNWSYSVPSFGGVGFQDGICMPKNPPHKERAIDFINFLLDPTVHLDIIETTKYPTTNRAARERAPGRLRDMLEAASGSSVKMYQLRDLSDQELRVIEQAWSRVKAA